MIRAWLHGCDHFQGNINGLAHMERKRNCKDSVFIHYLAANKNHFIVIPVTGTKVHEAPGFEEGLSRSYHGPRWDGNVRDELCLITRSGCNGRCKWGWGGHTFRDN